MPNMLKPLIHPSTALAKYLVAAMLLGMLVAGNMGYLDFLKDYFDTPRFTFTFGQSGISLYTALKGAFIIVTLLWVASIVSGAFQRRIRKTRKIKKANKALVVKLFQIILYIVTSLVALDVLGIDLTTLTIFSGALGIGIGFGLQKIASNFISGLILLFERSITVDDLVELDDGTFGFVKRTGARYTLLETLDNQEVLIPNEDFIVSKVVNWTLTNKQGRHKIEVGVSYGSDMQQVHDLLIEAAKQHPLCAKDPAPRCHMTEFGDSAVNFVLFFWVDDITHKRVTTHGEVMMNVWNILKEHHITIPFPQRDVHLITPPPTTTANKKRTTTKME